MNDKVIDRSGGDVAALAVQRSANARRLYEAREAFKSIVGAIKGAGNLDKLDSYQLRVVLDIVHTAWEFAGDQLNQIDNAEWKEAINGDNREN
jgi:hypothetical protein